MASRRQKVKVGVFLFFSILFLVIILALISGTQRFPTAIYHVIFNESVTGLDKGGDVRFNGVLVGTVDDILIGPSGSVDVVLKIRKDKLPEIRDGITAKLALRGITGIAYVELSGAGYGGVIPPGYTIPSEISFISNVTTRFPEILESLNEILVKTNKALGEPEYKFKEKVSDLFTGIDKASTAMSGFANEATSQTRIVSQNLNDLIENLDTEVKDTKTQLDRSLASLEKTIQNMNGKVSQLDLRTTQDKIQNLADRVSSTTLSLERFMSNTSQSVSHTEYNLHRSLLQLQSTLGSIERLVRILEADPSVLLYGERPPESRDRQRR